MKEAVIVAGVRTAVGKAPRGTLRTTRPDDMAATVIKDLLRRIPELSPESIDDVILGCATPEGESGTNVARIASLARRSATLGAGGHSQSLLFIGIANHCHGLGAHHGRHGRLHHCRRHRINEHAARQHEVPA